MNRRAGPALYEDLGPAAPAADPRVQGVLFDIKMVTTDKQNRRSGLGTDLLRRSVDLARSLGYSACKAEATGQRNC